MSFIAGINSALQGIGSVLGSASQIYGAVRSFGRAPAPAPAPLSQRVALMPPAPLPGRGGAPPSLISYGDERGLAPVGGALPAAFTPGAAGYLKMGLRMAERYGAWRQADLATPHPRTDVLDPVQADDEEFAKVLLQHGWILGDSDVGRLLEARGERSMVRSLAMSDGSRVRARVFPVGKSTRRRGKNYFTPARIRDASRTLAAAHRVVRIADKLGRSGKRLDSKLHPKRAGVAVACAPKRRAPARCK